MQIRRGGVDSSLGSARVASCAEGRSVQDTCACRWLRPHGGQRRDHAAELALAASSTKRVRHHGGRPGPGVETADGDLIPADTVYHGHGLQPGGSFVVRRAVAGEEPPWVFRTDRKATALDHDTETVYVTYDDGETVGLDLRDGNVR
ncbi:hypothetical protein [Streptomyces sp. NK08204]|uniref:hypothetical protein n=1 Tax=Streptomyces sp. NK08204 TaxID=2873260 RepID=UPI001CED3468|nr:hypothetical protein [Streptomyces sp. NK08204]